MLHHAGHERHRQHHSQVYMNPSRLLPGRCDARQLLAAVYSGRAGGGFRTESSESQGQSLSPQKYANQPWWVRPVLAKKQRRGRERPSSACAEVHWGAKYGPTITRSLALEAAKRVKEGFAYVGLTEDCFGGPRLSSLQPRRWFLSESPWARSSGRVSWL